MLEEFFTFKNISRIKEWRKLCLKLYKDIYKDSLDGSILYFKKGRIVEWVKRVSIDNWLPEL